jgi:hypothetical protein
MNKSIIFAATALVALAASGEASAQAPFRLQQQPLQQLGPMEPRIPGQLQQVAPTPQQRQVRCTSHQRPNGDVETICN